MSYFKTVNLIERTEEENRKFKAMLEGAIDKIEQAIDMISYSDKLIDENSLRLNQANIAKLTDMIIDLETISYDKIFKPGDVK